LKLVKGETYNYNFNNIAECGESKGHRVESNIILKYECKMDLAGFQCSVCSRDLKTGYYFLAKEDATDQYFFGTECVKKVITK